MGSGGDRKREEKKTHRGGPGRRGKAVDERKLAGEGREGEGEKRR